MTPFQFLETKRSPKSAERMKADQAALKAKRKRVNPFSALKILREKEGGVTLGFGAIVYGGYFMLLTTLPAELTAKFGYDSVTVGLCYLPVFVGSIFSRSIAGRLLDLNFRRHAKRNGIEINKGKQIELDRMPIEYARLQISIPMIYATALCVIAYGWVLEDSRSIRRIEITLFFVGLFANGGLSGLNTLVIDTHQESPATALAANNLFRCLVSAGCVALATPVIKSIGIGWLSVIIAGVWLASSPALWLVLIYGEQWRKEKDAKMTERTDARLSENDRAPTT